MIFHFNNSGKQDINEEMVCVTVFSDKIIRQDTIYLLKGEKEHFQKNRILNLPIKELWSVMHIEREIWKGGKLVGEKSVKSHIKYIYF